MKFIAKIEKIDKKINENSLEIPLDELQRSE